MDYEEEDASEFEQEPVSPDPYELANSWPSFREGERTIEDEDRRAHFSVCRLPSRTSSQPDVPSRMLESTPWVEPRGDRLLLDIYRRARDISVPPPPPKKRGVLGWLRGKKTNK